jgi:hypothetical protein
MAKIESLTVLSQGAGAVGTLVYSPEGV